MIMNNLQSKSTIEITCTGSQKNLQMLLQQINQLNENSTKKINYVEYEDTIICSHCHSVINIENLNDNDKQKILTTHLCKNCQRVLEEAALILNSTNQSSPQEEFTQANEPIKFAGESKITRPVNENTNEYNQMLSNLVTSTQKPKISAGRQCRNLIFKAIPKMTTEHMNMFCDEDTSKELFGILYPLFVKITNMTDIQIDNARKCRGFYRYFAKKYHILNDDYLMCNDLYERNIIKFNNSFIDLKLIDGEKIQIPSRKHKNNSSDLPAEHILNIDAELSNEEIIKSGLALPDKSHIHKKDIIDIVSFNPNTAKQEVIQHKKKTKEELLQDVAEIEQQQKRAKKERLSKIKSQFNFSTKHLPTK